MTDQLAPAPRRSPLALAVLASLVVHAMFAGAIRIAAQDDEPPMNLVDITLAPEAPVAEVLGPEKIEEPPPEAPSEDDIVSPPEPPPEPPKPPPPVNDFAFDAGVPDAAPPEPVDAATKIAIDETPPPEPTDAGALASRDQPSDGGVQEGAPSDGGVDGPAATAATAANLLTHFPSKHMVSVLLRFDRLRGTEWAEVMQDVLAAMPDYKTLIADPKTVVADKFDLVAMSSARYKDAGATILAMKTSVMTHAELRDFLDEPGAPVTWSRVSGGILGTRGEGDRVMKRDTRVFLSPFSEWTVLAKPKDLKGALDPVDGDLDAVQVDYAKLPPWLAQVPTLEAESGKDDGPAVMMTLAPKSKRWELPPFGLEVSELPAPERLSLTATLDKQGFIIKGNLKMRSAEDAEELVKSLEAVKAEALDSPLLSGLLEKAHAKNLISGLSLIRSGDRVTYASSISIADARVLFGLGTSLVVDYFAELSAPADPPAEQDAGPPP